MQIFKQLVAAIGAIGFSFLGLAFIAIGVAGTAMLFAAVHWWGIALLLGIVAFAIWGVKFAVDRIKP